MVYCGQQSLVSDESVAIPLRCRCYDCDHCGPIKRVEIEGKARAGDATHFVTLTVKPARYANSAAGRAEAAADLQGAWRKVRRTALRRGLRLPFIAVFEGTENGWPHLHMLVRTEGFLSQRWLSAQMAKLIGAPVVHIRRARPSDSHYIAKAPVSFPGRRRCWSSADWLLVRLVEFARQVWRRLPFSLDVLECRLRSLRWDYIRAPRRLEWCPP